MKRILYMISEVKLIMKAMKKKKLLALILLVAALTGAAFQILLSNLLVGEQVRISTEKLQFENYAQTLSTENYFYKVTNAVPQPKENSVKLEVAAEDLNVEGPENQEGFYKENRTYGGSKTSDKFLVTPETWDTATKTSGKVIVLQERKSETESPPVYPISASLGIAVSLIFGAVWLSRQEAMGNATTVLLEKGLENMSVRGAEIVGEIMRKNEFTIPELMEKAGTSKITTWRTVKKLVDKGLVKETDRTRKPSRGLGGRGKPSKIYEYAGTETEKE